MLSPTVVVQPDTPPEGLQMNGGRLFYVRTPPAGGSVDRGVAEARVRAGGRRVHEAMAAQVSLA